MNFSNQPDETRSPRRRGHAPRNVPFLRLTLLWGSVLLCWAGVLVWILAAPKVRTSSRRPAGQFQADVRTVAATLRYLSDLEREGATPDASSSALAQPPLGETSSCVACNYPSNRSEIPGKRSTNGSGHI